MVVVIDAVNGTIESTNPDGSSWPVYWLRLAHRSPAPLDPKIQNDVATRVDLAQTLPLAASWHPLLPLTVPTGFIYYRLVCSYCQAGFSIAL